MRLEKQHLLLIRPRFLVDVGVEVVVPSLSALFARPLNSDLPRSEVLGHVGPVVDAHLRHYGFEAVVFLDGR